MFEELAEPCRGVRGAVAVDTREAARWARFVATSSLGMVVNYSVSMALFLHLPLFAEWYPLAAACGTIAGMGLNFAGARLYAFRAKPG